MNESLANLDGFIFDFRLRQLTGAVSFNALINFNINGNKNTHYSEVHIITSDNIAAIYFLNPDLNSSGLPDFFDIKSHRFIYITGKSLMLENDNYLINIHPAID